MSSFRIGDALRHPIGSVSGNLQIGFALAAANDLYDGGSRFRVRIGLLTLVGLRKQLE
jgi:hypothetical protein